MKTTLLLFCALLFVGCDEDEKDHFVGSWSYTGVEASAVFIITNVYTISDAQMDGVDCNSTALTGEQKGVFIDLISIKTNDLDPDFSKREGFSFLNLTLSSDRKSLLCDTVAYLKGSSITLYFNQTLTDN